jgi:hypothetical protein
MPKNNLSLGNLFRATVGSSRVGASSLNQRNASAGTQISIGAFAIDSVTATPPSFTYIVESTTENATFTFGSPGAAHATRVGSVAANYSVTFNNGNFSVGTPSLGASPSFPVTPAGVGSTVYSEASASLSMKYEDGFNTTATGYNSTTTKVLYAVDVYNTINQPDFCLLFNTPITKADGSVVSVEDLVVGDVIKAWVPAGLPDEDQDPESDQLDWRFYMLEDSTGEAQDVVVKDVTFNFASGYHELNNGLIKATGTHPLWVWNVETEKYHFKAIQDILIGDKVVTYTDEDGLAEVEIIDIAVITEDVEIVTINVENADVYLANGIISHNKGTTTQPYIPSAGLRMYLDPSKSASTAGTATADWLDLSGYNTGVRPAGVTNTAGISGGNPSYNNGASRKEKYWTTNGTNQFWYKDTTTNINGGISQFNTNTGTIHVWIRPTTTLGVATRTIFDYAGFYRLSIESNDNSSLNRIAFNSPSLGGLQVAISALSTNVWYMVSVAFQPSGTCTIYLDGVSAGTFTSSPFTAPSSTNYLTIGSNSARTLFWNGQIGPVLFYNTLQSLALVDQVYDYFSPTYK